MVHPTPHSLLPESVRPNELFWLRPQQESTPLNCTAQVMDPCTENALIARLSHAPAKHPSPAPQARPHAPQCCTSLWRSLHSAPHCVSPSAQLEPPDELVPSPPLLLLLLVFEASGCVSADTSSPTHAAIPNPEPKLKPTNTAILRMLWSVADPFAFAPGNSRAQSPTSNVVTRR